MKEVEELHKAMQIEICRAFLRKYGFTKEEADKILEGIKQ